MDKYQKPILKCAKERQRLSRTYLLIKCMEAAGFSWSAATYTIFLTTVAGLTDEQTTQVNIAFMIGNFFIDMPTGAIADAVGHVPIYLLGLVILGLGIGGYAWATNIWLCLAAELVSALGTALMSSALEAHLSLLNGTRIRNLVRTKERIISPMASIPAALIGGWAAVTFGYEWPWILSGITFLTAALVGGVTLSKFAKYAKDHRTRTNGGEKFSWAQVADNMKAGFALISKSSDRILLCTLSFMFVAAMQPINMFWTKIVVEHYGGKPWWLGSLWIGVAVLAALGADRAKKTPQTWRYLSFAFLLVGVPLLLGSLSANPYIIAFMFVTHEFGRGWAPRVIENKFNQWLPGEISATANSAADSLDRLGRVVGLSVAGILTRTMSYNSLWLIAALVVLAICVVPLFKKER